MASPAAAEEHSNTKTDEGTTAFHKKRSRRVSFAENTSVHIFDRDEESGTPPGSVLPNSPNEDLGFTKRDSDSRRFFRNEEDDDGEDEDGDMHELGPRIPFVRVVGSLSPSSGGSTIGSATSNDEANFFGPVSTSFIRRDLSDSYASDDNHDQTMDSTAFNIHFRSIARSESGDLKTSTGIPLSFEEKTPNSNLSCNTSSMLLTLAKIPSYEHDISTSKLSSESQSNDMSLVGEYHDKYNYGKLSPALNALLTEDNNDLHVVSNNSVLKSPKKYGNQFLENKENGSDLMDFSYNQDNKMEGGTSHEELNEVVSVKHNEKGVPDDGFNSESLSTIQNTPSNSKNTVMEKENKFQNGVNIFKSPGNVTPHNQTTVFPTTDSLQRVSSLRKSISKLRILEASPFSAALNAKLQDSNLKSVVSISKMTPLSNKSPKISYFEDPLPSSVTKMDNNNNNNNTETPKNFKVVSPEEQIQPKFLNSADVRYGYKDDENNIEHESSQLIFRVTDESFGDKSCQKNLADEFATSPSNYNNIAMNQLPNPDVNSTERKRKNEDVNTEKNAKVKMSSNSGPNLEHSAKIYTTFFKETKLFSSSVEKMNLHAIDHLVDIVGQLHRSKTYQLLSNEIQSQCCAIPSSIIQHKRVAETKLLLCNIVHEKAKLQLLYVKRERLLKNKQSIASGIQESEALKLNLSSQNSQNVQVFNKNIQECQIDNTKVTSMMQTVKDINGRISNLTKNFNISCKMKEELNPSDTIAFVNDHLMKRAQCQIIRKDLQLWVVDNLQSSKDHHDVVFNYLDLVFQRFTVTAGVIPSISISNILNEANIQKNFKDMDSLTAFGFVFDAKSVGATNLAQETQMTSHILGNLVDVMEEIQVARIELKNLIYARFKTVLGERLDLELYFFDSNSRKKATITLNTSCLKSGIYPSDIVACQIDIPVQNSFSQNLSGEISAAVANLSVGFLRILRVCRCVSQLVS